MILPRVTLIGAVKAWAWRPQQAINIRQSEESRKSPAKTTKTKFHCCNWVRCDTKALKHHCDHKWHCRRQCKGSVWGLQQVGPPRSKQRKKGELGRLLIVLHMIPWSVYQKCEKRLWDDCGRVLRVPSLSLCMLLWCEKFFSGSSLVPF